MSVDSDASADHVGHSGHRADGMKAAAWIERRQAGRRGNGGGHAEISVVIIIVAPARPRTDREDVIVAVAKHEVRRQIAGQAVMPAEPFAAFGAKPEILAD